MDYWILFSNHQSCHLKLKAQNKLILTKSDKKNKKVRGRNRTDLENLLN